MKWFLFYVLLTNGRMGDPLVAGPQFDITSGQLGPFQTNSACMAAQHSIARLLAEESKASPAKKASGDYWAFIRPISVCIGDSY